jgi:transposase-like protein
MLLVLGLWIEQTEGAKFWLRVMNELRDRGVADILIAAVDGLKGFPEAINAVFPKTQVLGLRRQHRLSRHAVRPNRHAEAEPRRLTASAAAKDAAR